MKISNAGSVVTIEGNIKNISDFQKIKTCLDNIAQNSASIKIKIVDSISITSSVIGYLTKLIHKDKINISIDIGDLKLYELLDELGLILLFDVKRSWL